MVEMKPSRTCRYCDEPCRRKYNKNGRFKAYASVCASHFGQRRGTESPHFLGGRRTLANGVIMVLDPAKVGRRKGSRYTPEHRLVMAKMMGRPLFTEERVRHINGDLGDNRESNLTLDKEKPRLKPLLRIAGKVTSRCGAPTPLIAIGEPDDPRCSKCEESLLTTSAGRLMHRAVSPPGNHGFFSSIETPDQAYWLGFLAADGNVRGNTIALRLAIRDLTHVQAFAVVMGRGGQTKTSGGPFPSAAFFMTSYRVASDLFKLGVTPVKSLTLRPWHPSPDLAAHYWRGVFDGDGGFSYQRTKQRLYPRAALTGTFDVVEAFRAFIIESGGEGRGRAYHHGRASWRVSWTGHGAESVAAILDYGAGPSLGRKAEMARSILAARRRPAAASQIVES